VQDADDDALDGVADADGGVVVAVPLPGGAGDADEDVLLHDAVAADGVAAALLRDGVSSDDNDVAAPPLPGADGVDLADGMATVEAGVDASLPRPPAATVAACAVIALDDAEEERRRREASLRHGGRLGLVACRRGAGSARSRAYMALRSRDGRLLLARAAARPAPPSSCC